MLYCCSSGPNTVKYSTNIQYVVNPFSRFAPGCLKDKHLFWLSDAKNQATCLHRDWTIDIPIICSKMHTKIILLTAFFTYVWVGIVWQI